MINSFEFGIYCGDSSGRVVGDFGREGDGPGEFRHPAYVERGPTGLLGVIDLKLDRLSFFYPDGTRVSSGLFPSGYLGNGLSNNHMFGSKRAAPPQPNRSKGRSTRTFFEVDVSSGEVLWERTGIDELVDLGCGRVGPGWPSPQGGYVFWACEHELVFLDHREARGVTVLPSPTYAKELPNERDVEAYASDMIRLAGTMALPRSAMDPYVAGFKEDPKKWFLVPGAIKFDHQGRLWVATTRDRDAYSYIDVWTDTEYAGTLRIRDRLVGYDLHGSTFAALVERVRNSDGIVKRVIDWYDVSNLAIGS